jgi:hypothetical protein
MSPRALKILGALEVAASTALALVAVWILAPRLHLAGMVTLVYLAGAFTALYGLYISPVIIHGDPAGVRGLGTWRTCFVRTDNLRAASLVYGGFTAGTLIAIVAWIAIFDPARAGQIYWKSVPVKFALYLVSATVQDLFWLSFILVRLKGVFSKDGRASEGMPQPLAQVAICALCAGQFVLYHAPNLPLMGASLVAGLIISRLYLSIPNLLAAALSHAVIGTALHRIVGLCMRSGPFYEDQTVYPLRTLFPFTKNIIRDMW